MLEIGNYISKKPERYLGRQMGYGIYNAPKTQNKNSRTVNKC